VSSLLFTCECINEVPFKDSFKEAPPGEMVAGRTGAVGFAVVFVAFSESA